MFLIRLAWLNMYRNTRRTLISVSAVALGVAALIFLWAFIDGYQDQQRENAIRLFFGHVQITPKNFRKKIAPELTIADREKVLEVARSAPNVVAVTERIHAEVLVGTSENSRGAVLFGIDPLREREVTDVTSRIVSGNGLTPGDNRSIVIGKGLAERLNVPAGGKVVVMTQSVDGTLAGYSYKVTGLLDTGTVIDDIYVLTTKEAAQELLGIENRIQELVVRLTNREKIPQFLAHASSRLDEKTDILPWYILFPEIEQWAKFSWAIVRTILVTVTFVIGIGLMNVILISIFERVKEFGVMLAIGTSPRQMLGLVLLEGLAIQFAGVITGLILGFAITEYASRVGIRLEGIEDAARQAFMNPVIYPQFRLSRALESIVSLFAMSSLVGIYPAWRAGKLEPVKAIYHG